MAPFAEVEVDGVAGGVCGVCAVDVDGARVADPAVVGWGCDEGYVGAVGGGEILVVQEGLGGCEVFWSGVEADGFEGGDCGCEGDYLVSGFGVEGWEGGGLGGEA